ncbi:MAG: protein kinase domain-containing protein [Hyphomicrobiales bacterium]
MTLSPGTRLGTYQITGSLGAGGMGEVYRARDTRLGREVAVKVLPEAVTASPDRLARFEREARTVAGLSHPNIVTLFSVEDEGGVRFLTMELVDGQSLDRLVAPGGLPVARVLDLAIPLANALIAAHERGVVHRDLKPGNVMVTHDGWVKVLDFGLAKVAEPGEKAAAGATVALGATAEAPISGAGQVLGTVPYMAPEQVRGEAVDARADLFAFGIIVYELATGRRPFTGATPADVSSSILRDAPAPVVSLRADLPRDLNRIVARCLEKNPKDRFQTARDVYNELRYVKREIESGAGAIGATPPTPARPAVMPTPGGPATPPAWRPATPTPTPVSPTPRTPTPGSAASRTPSGLGPTDAVPSIAVLPFVNRSSQEEDEYFSDGLADELLNVLTKIRGLRVAARASSFQFKGKNEDLAVIGEKLNVAALLDGSVRKSGNRVRISVQLIQAADRVQLWSETYDRSLDDIFAVQDDIAQSVVKELRTTLLGEAPGSDASGRAEVEVAQVAKGHGQNPEAHRLYLQGKYFVDRLTGPDTERGIQYLEQALALDPSHAAAWADLSRAHSNAGGYGWEPVFEGYAKAREAAERAIQLEPDLASGYVRLAIVQRLHEWDWAGAEASMRRALELAPGSAEALRSAATLDHQLCHYEQSERLFLRSIEQDPLNSGAYSSLGLLYRSMDRLEDAERAFRKSLELSPNRIASYSGLALVLAAMGRDAEAVAAGNAEPAEWARFTCLALAHHAGGRRAQSDEALRRLEEGHAVDAPFQIAAIHAARGESDAAFAWLERALAERDAGVPQVKCEPTFRSLHGDPRWPALLAKIGLEP